MRETERGREIKRNRMMEKEKCRRDRERDDRE